MCNFDLGRQFDIITCLFSSIGYVRTIAGLNQAIANFERHLKPGGLMFVEPWFTPEDWHTSNIHATFVDQPGLKISRMNLSEREGNLSRFVFHYLVGTLMASNTSLNDMNWDCLQWTSTCPHFEPVAGSYSGPLWLKWTWTVYGIKIPEK
jgi:hypothetical protein